MTFEIINADVLDGLRGIADGSVDAVITDPPYCSGGFSESARRQATSQGLRSETVRRDGWFSGDNMGTQGLCYLMREVAVQARRILKPTGHLLTFCDWRMQAALEPAMESAGLRFTNLVVWDKKSAGLGTGFRAQHELILHFTNGSPEYHSASFGNVLSLGRTSAQGREHPTQKPVELIERLIKVVAPVGGLVVDPFTGSGSTGIACMRLDRSFLGIEINPDYAEMARRRISEDCPMFNRPAEVVA